MKKRKLLIVFNVILLFGLSLILYNCEKEKDSIQIVSEKNKIEYGITIQELLKSKAIYNVNKKLIKVKSKSKNQIDIYQISDRLDLKNTYYLNTDSIEILNSPVKVLGDYKRELLSITKNKKNLSLVLTYPDPNNKKLFYVSDLKGNLIEKVTIQENGTGLVEKLNLSLSKGNSTCIETIYTRCSSGAHSFSYQNAGDCIYWNQPGGTPPSVFTTTGTCLNEDVSIDNPTGGDGSGFGNEDGSNPDGLTIPPTGSGPGDLNSQYTQENCIPNLDCNDCNLAGDWNNNCDLDDNEECVLSIGENFLNKLNHQNKSLIYNYINENGCSVEAEEIMNQFNTILDDLPDARFDRYLELLDLIKEDPWSLIEDCMQQNGLNMANYQQLYNHTLPQSCINKLNNLGSEFKDQPINTGNAAVANVDYYSVEITANPDFNLDGMPDTDTEVFEAYRANFTDLASGNKTDFQFSCNVPFDLDNKADVSWTFVPYSQADATIWNSNNPLTTIIAIDAWGDVVFSELISDDGAIMISSYTNQYWIGSTIQTAYTSSQPFSGNRQWGFNTNQSGNLELYARAVDVARVSDITLFGPGTNECKEETYYNIGDTTWSNLQEEIKNWVNAYGGQAKIIPRIAIRFDKTKLKELLEKNETIDQIN